ncbi:hypothetical protein BKA65DRAFT_530439 [Rhexocercosporidium sp. MPI-PUGE-AT-0058]|nr:hypothetical protein BKA65DRAFT_530439 [Rhexocercosporidium sp. MPI-PUGE-AT-0058]
MTFLSVFRNPAILGALNISTLLGLSEDHEARMDELEGTLRGHIGLIEEALDRLEGTATEADRGKKMNEVYGKRGQDDK